MPWSRGAAPRPPPARSLPGRPLRAAEVLHDPVISLKTCQVPDRPELDVASDGWLGRRAGCGAGRLAGDGPRGRGSALGRAAEGPLTPRAAPSSRAIPRFFPHGEILRRGTPVGSEPQASGGAHGGGGAGGGAFNPGPATGGLCPTETFLLRGTRSPRLVTLSRAGPGGRDASDRREARPGWPAAGAGGPRGRAGRGPGPRPKGLHPTSAPQLRTAVGGNQGTGRPPGPHTLGAGTASLGQGLGGLVGLGCPWLPASGSAHV